MMMKRFLAVLLAAMMVFCLLPAGAAFADDNNPLPTGDDPSNNEPSRLRVYGTQEIDDDANNGSTDVEKRNIVSGDEGFTNLTKSGTITVYFTDACNWGAANCYYWNDGPEWPGTAMTAYDVNDYGQQIYSAMIPANVTGVIFNGNGNQTVDITEGIADGVLWYTTGEKDGNKFKVVREDDPFPETPEAELCLQANNNGTTLYTREYLPYPVGTVVAVPENFFDDEYGTRYFEYEGHRFTGWNTAADGSGVPYAPGDTLTLNADFTLYAQWEAVITVSFTDALGWGGVNVYYWNNGPAWPGTAITASEVNDLGQTVYTAVIPADVTGVIFNGGGNQTVDITEGIVDGAHWYTTGEKDDSKYKVARTESLVTVSFALEGGSDAFNLSWTEHTQYPERWAMDPESVVIGSDYTLPACTIVPPDNREFDHWQVVFDNDFFDAFPGEVLTFGANAIVFDGDSYAYQPENGVTVRPVWADREWDTEFEIESRPYNGEPVQFFVHQFLTYYVPADMVKFNADGNKDPYEQNIYILWYAVENGVRGDEVSRYMFYSPSENAPGGAYIQAQGPSDVGDYELVVTYQGNEVINQFFSITEAVSEHTYELAVSLDREFDGEPVSFDPDKDLVVDKGATSWGVLAKDGYRYLFQLKQQKGESVYYVDLDSAPSDVGEYRLAIQKGDEKTGYTDEAAFDFAITEAAAQYVIELHDPQYDVLFYPGDSGMGEEYTSLVDTIVLEENAETGLYTGSYHFTVNGGMNNYANYWLNVLIGGEAYTENGTRGHFAYKHFPIADSANMTLRAYPDEETDEMYYLERYLSLFISHSGTYTFTLNPDTLAFTIAYSYDTPDDEPLVYLFGFEPESAQAYTLGSVLGAITAKEHGAPIAFDLPTRAEVPTQNGEEPVWAFYLYDEAHPNLFVCYDGAAYGSTEIVNGVPAEGVTVSLTETPQDLSLNLPYYGQNEFDSPTFACYDFYYFTGSRNLVIQRRAGSLTVESVQLVGRDANDEPIVEEMELPEGLALTADNSFFSGDEITGSAPYVEGMRFVGWMVLETWVDQETGEPGSLWDTVTGSFAFAFHAESSLTLYAVYEAMDPASVESSFPDPAFRAYVSAEIDADHDGILSGAEIGAVTVIDLSGEYQDGQSYAQAVESLEGIELFPLLEELYCDPFTFSVSGYLAEVDLSQNLELRVIDLGCNPISFLNVEAFSKLEDLNLGFTSLQGINLGSNKALKRLTVNNTRLPMLSLYANSELEWLDACGLALTGGIDLSDCPKLLADYLAGPRDLTDAYPYLAGKQIYGQGDGSIPYSLAVDEGVTLYFCYQNLIEDEAFSSYVYNELDPDCDGRFTLADVNAVTVIELDGEYRNPEDWDGEYTYADCVTSLKGIELFPNLEELYCDPFSFGVDGHLAEVDLSGNTKLKVVDLGCNPIAALDVTMLPDLEELAVGYTELQTIDLHNNPNLRTLIISDSKLTALDLTNNRALAVLDCCGNDALEFIDISGTPLEADYLAGELHFDLPYLTENIHVYGANDPEAGGQLYRLAVNTHMQVKAGDPVAHPAVSAKTYLTDGEQVGTLTGVSIAVGNHALGSAEALYCGNYVTVTAPLAPGFSFDGWFAGDTKIGENRTCSFAVQNGMPETIAHYTANGTVTLTINGGEQAYTINGEVFSGTIMDAYRLGAVVTVAVDESRTNFAYWSNSYDKVLSRQKMLTFTVTTAQSITAVFNTTVNEKATLVFESDYGQIMARNQLGVGQEMDIPSVPVKNGFDPLGWDFNEDGKIDNTDTLANAIALGLQKENQILTIRPIYEQKTATYAITVVGGSGSGTYRANAVVTAAAQTPEGKQFSHWKEGDMILSYDEQFLFYAEKDMTLTAVFVNDGDEVEAVGETAIINKTADANNRKLTFVSMSTVPEGCTIVFAGLIATDAENVANGEFTTETATFVRGDAWSGRSYQYTWTKSNVDAGKVWYVRGCLIYNDTNGNRQTVYGAVVQNSY